MSAAIVQRECFSSHPMSQDQRHHIVHQLQNALAAVMAEAAGAAEARAVRATLRARADRAKYFDSRLFSDPAWDILLDLYAAHLEQRRMSISNLGLAAGVPPTTALRWIVALQKKGLIRREDDPLDGRRAFVFLSNEGVQAMTDYFRSNSPTV